MIPLNLGTAEGQSDTAAEALIDAEFAKVNA
jgi:hypothetical protein